LAQTGPYVERSYYVQATTPLAYNGYGQTTSITPSGQAADTFAYAGPDQGERTGQGSSAPLTSYANGLTGVQSQTSPTSSTLFERDPNGTLLSAQTTTGTTTTSTYFYFDGTGSVIGLLDPSGKQVATYTYDPYGGHPSVGVGEAPDRSQADTNPWRYAAGQYDPITGLTKFGARLLRPVRRPLDATRPAESPARPAPRQPLQLRRSRPHQQHRPQRRWLFERCVRAEPSRVRCNAVC